MGTAAYSSGGGGGIGKFTPNERASATDTPFRRLEVCLCQCLCSSENAYLPLSPRKWDSSIDAVALTLLSAMDNRSCRSRSHSRLMDIRSRRSRSHSRLRDIRGHRSRPAMPVCVAPEGVFGPMPVGGAMIGGDAAPRRLRVFLFWLPL